MTTPLGLGGIASMVRARKARARADQALRLATRSFGADPTGELDRHAIAADDAAFLAEQAANLGRHDEVRARARDAWRELRTVRSLTAGSPSPDPGV